ncbi:hypothetical protein [Clavibacter sp. Sh2088]|uniref:hypothetical protein n=1 Tax=Clavibacter sp. Sh2088 TaxID=3397676 RepID=UPI0039DFD74F
MWPTLLVALSIVGFAGSATSGATAGEREPRRSATTLDYDFGPRSFSVPDLTDSTGRPSPMELQGRVHLPPGAAKGLHPVVVLVPGYWPTCADAEAQRITEDPKSSEEAVVAAYDRLNQWPCAKGISQIPSHRGFDHLARALSDSGNIVISIGANGANAIDTRSFEGDQARAALITKHLEMWQEFVATGKGPLSAVLPADIRTHVDMKDVGLAGHSRAGRAVLQYAADANRAKWPKGVTIRAVLGLAPASAFGTDPATLTNTGTDVGIIGGSCDGVSNPPFDPYFAAAVTGSHHPAYRWMFRGANHNYSNMQWSPSSGQVAAHDDAVHPPGQPDRCYDAWSTVEQLSEDRQRLLTRRYVSAFFASALHDDRRGIALLDGSRPAAGVTTEKAGGKQHSPTTSL